MNKRAGISLNASSSTYEKQNSLFTAYWDDFNIITVMIHETASESLSFRLTDGQDWLPVSNIRELENEPVNQTIIQLQTVDPLNAGQEYFVVDQKGNSCLLLTGKVVRTEEFDRRYAYQKDDLGSILNGDRTIFKIWAPTAIQVKLNLYDKKQNFLRVLDLVREENGTWAHEEPGRLEGNYYRYLINVNGRWNKAVDPYAKALSVNGEFGVVLDLAKTNPPGWNPFHKPEFKNATDAIIYELHVRDFSIQSQSGMVHKGKYRALTEKHTKGPLNTTSGMDYLKDLGVTHVELLPIQDYGSVDESAAFPNYNWGYDPTHYFVPEGSYSTDPFDPVQRIKEVKEMVAAFHENGIRVIMDVVFNHIYIIEDSSLEKIVPGYYFRYDKGGKPSNGTGVGNDTASERFMMRKLMVDSVRFWIKEYGIDGFRFDLMGIHDIETMNVIRREIDEIDPSILMIGEGWNMHTILADDQKAKIEHASKMPGICHFNDRFRDAVKGKLFNQNDQGFATGNLFVKDQIVQCIMGSTNTLFSAPGQSINYVECHDNHTLWDRMLISNSFEEELIREKRHLLASALVLLSQGIPFIHAGQEFFRTKYGVENSYASPDEINQFDWQKKAGESRSVNYIKGLIQLRREHPCFRLQRKDQIREHLTFYEYCPSLLIYKLHHLKEIDSWNEVVVVHNAGIDLKKIQVDPLKNWHVVVDNDKAGVTALYSLEMNEITVSPLSTLVMYN
ncbi:type I pullulanase [Pseudalkalibacillus caeni]|uniref:Type I pullulanase n=1 Tax=Exobacillus caeni TaxID=2574798 RepID=A0A5R9F971_9BACL|nr:type I pullulanase [Pseudalkalibacillus caeni]TLS39059.1 type I pullulanase [Pseudalkalibacillus caeni]